MAFALKASLSPSSSPPASLTAATPPVKPVFVRALATASVDPAMATPAALGRHAVRARAAATTLAPAPLPAGNGGLSVAKAMSRARDNGMTAFIPYITAGDPDLATTAEALRLLDTIGADVIEVGLPFSDPYADGPVIQASAARALSAGVTTDAVMAMLKEVTPELSCPVVIFSYFNPIARRGTGRFTAAAREAGVRGLIVPDLPYIETSVLRNEAIQNDIELVLLTTPSTKAGMMNEITIASEGFVYLVSINGVTGARPDVNPRVKDLLKEIKQVTNKAVVVGFGISTPDHIRLVAQWGADGVIIGSAMVKQLGEADSPREGLKRLEVYARSLKDALSGGSTIGASWGDRPGSPMSWQGTSPV
ncbi:tryptophan synthase alpha chain-like [Triticum urartu]|uniref:Tryptophan synthase n=1 Tax=Triticum urartu TaxID=4572 RepID=A0A8R7UL91_TRIUA|nr:tryptophan synthase alpha chain-like [Triticum urartu]XP_048526969.1 tryptophan synthase alpha chain-like [Triticum urartu]XP_048526970.1 tryptophan synthase alpha chain-like [Triticum urartu]